MESDKRDSSPAGTTGRHRRAPTIDLTATEIESDAKEATAASEAEAAVTSADNPSNAENPPHPQQTMDPQTAAEEPQEQSAGAPEESPPKADKDVRRPLFRLSKSHLAVGLAGGGAVLVLIAVFWGAGLMQVGSNDAGALTARLAVLELQVRDLNDRIAARTLDPKSIENLLARVASLETTAAAPKPLTTDPQWARRIAAVEQAVKAAGNSTTALAEKTANLDRQINDSVVAIRDARNRVDAAAAVVAEIEKNIARAGVGRVERSDLESLAARVANLEGAVKAAEDALAQRAPRPNSGAEGRAIRLAVAAGALRSAVEGGRPFAAELATVKSLTDNASALAPLAPFAAKGLPDDATLARGLLELLPAMRRAVGDAKEGDGFLQRLQANAEKLVRIQPIKGGAGDDPAAVLTRVEAQARGADIVGALAELDKLPPSARAPAQGWIASAKAHQSAKTASRRFAAEAIAALGKPSP